MLESRLSVAECAYLAGLFDGEGTVGYYFKSALGYHVAQVAIYNADLTVMAWIRQRIPVGAVTANKKSKHKGWAWMLSTQSQVVAFLTAIRPYLVIKANQVDLLLSSLDAEQETRGGKRTKLSVEDIARRNDLVTELKRLKTANFQPSNI